MIILYKNWGTNAVGAFNTKTGVSQRFTQKTLPKLEKLLNVKVKIMRNEEIQEMKNIYKIP